MNNHQLAEQIIEQMSDALIFADIEGNIQAWNRASCELFGFSKLEAMGESLDLIIPERIRGAHWQGFHESIRSGTLKLSGKPTLTRALHKDEEKRLYVEMSFALVKNENGEVLGSVAIARDVTDKMNR